MRLRVLNTTENAVETAMTVAPLLATIPDASDRPCLTPPIARTIDVLVGPEFISGLWAGSIALFVTIGLGFATAPRLRAQHGVGGVFLAIAAMIAMSVAAPVPPRLWFGVGLLAVGGACHQAVSTRWARPLLVLPGGLLIAAETTVLSQQWVGWFVLVFILVAASLAGAFAARSSTSPWTAAMVSVFAVGIFLTVPDTEEAMVFLGAAAPFLLLSLPRLPASLGATGTYALVGLGLWVITQGGVGRPASIIPAAACLGLLVAEPVAAWISRDGRTPIRRLPVTLTAFAAVTGMQLVLVALISRLAGQLNDVGPAMIITTGLLLLTVTVLAWSGSGR